MKTSATGICAFCFKPWAVMLGLAAVLWVMPAQAVFINEIHYDNAGADVAEGIELAGAAGQDLAGWSLVFYNGRADRRSPYATYALSGVFGDMQNGFGVLVFDDLGFRIQNGSPDAVALVDAFDTVVQFLGYEGSFVAATGPAAGLASVDIGVAEDAQTPPGYALQLTGTGRDYADFRWGAGPMAASFGGINPGQSFVDTSASSAMAVVAPSSLQLFVAGGMALSLLSMLRRRAGPTRSYSRIPCLAASRTALTSGASSLSQRFFRAPLLPVR